MYCRERLVIDKLSLPTAALWRSVVPGICVVVVFLMTYRPGVTAGEEFSLSLPVACEIGTVCTIQNGVVRGKWLRHKVWAARGFMR